MDFQALRDAVREAHERHDERMAASLAQTRADIETARREYAWALADCGEHGTRPRRIRQTQTEAA